MPEESLCSRTFGLDDLPGISQAKETMQSWLPSIPEVGDALATIKEAAQELADCAKLEWKKELWKYEFGPVSAQARFGYLCIGHIFSSRGCVI